MLAYITLLCQILNLMPMDVSSASCIWSSRPNASLFFVFVISEEEGVLPAEPEGRDDLPEDADETSALPACFQAQNSRGTPSHEVSSLYIT